MYPQPRQDRSTDTVVLPNLAGCPPILPITSDTCDLSLQTEVFEEEERRVALYEMVGLLSEEQSNVLCMRFGLDGGVPMTLKEIGTTLHIGSERVRQVEARALRELRHPSKTRHIMGYCRHPSAEKGLVQLEKYRLRLPEFVHEKQNLSEKAAATKQKQRDAATETWRRRQEGVPYNPPTFHVPRPVYDAQGLRIGSNIGDVFHVSIRKYMHCSQCGTFCSFIGSLGSRLHFRCPSCGLDHSTTDPPEDENDGQTDHHPTSIVPDEGRG